MIYSLKIPRHRWVSIPLTPCQRLTGSRSGSDPWQALIKMWTGRLLLNIQIVFFPLTPFFFTCENWNCCLSSPAVFLSQIFSRRVKIGLSSFLSRHFSSHVKIEIVPPFFFPLFFLVVWKLNCLLSSPAIFLYVWNWNCLLFSFQCFFFLTCDS